MIAITMLAIFISPVLAVPIMPDAKFRVRDGTPGYILPDGTPDSLFINSEVVTNIPSFVDEAFAEFSLSGLNGASVTFDFDIRINNSPSPPRDVKVSFYEADGIASLTDFGAGIFLTQVTSIDFGSNLFSIDVTSQVNNALTLGQTHLGFRFHDPVFTSTTEGTQVFFDEGALNVTPIPEPVTMLLLGSGMAGLIVWKRNRR